MKQVFWLASQNLGSTQALGRSNGTVQLQKLSHPTNLTSQLSKTPCLKATPRFETLAGKGGDQSRSFPKSSIACSKAEPGLLAKPHPCPESRPRWALDFPPAGLSGRPSPVSVVDDGVGDGVHLLGELGRVGRELLGGRAPSPLLGLGAPVLPGRRLLVLPPLAFALLQSDLLLHLLQVAVLDGLTVTKGLEMRHKRNPARSDFKAKFPTLTLA